MDGYNMASAIASAYALVLASLSGQVFSGKEIRVLMAHKYPAINPASLNPSDYRGVRNAQGKIERAASQATQYAPIFFENVNGLYKVLPKAEWQDKPVTGRSLRGVSDAAVLAELVRRGVVPKDAGIVAASTVPAKPAQTTVPAKPAN